MEVNSAFDEVGEADLAYIEPGSAHVLTYRLEAPTGSPLDAIVVQSDCPCVTGVDLPNEVPAGEAAILQIAFDAPEKIVHYQHSFEVLAESDGELLMFPLAITARIGLPLLVVPESVTLLPGSIGNTEIELRNDGNEPIRLTYALSSNPSVSLAVPREPVKSGESIKLPITVTAAWTASSSPAHIQIRTTSTSQPAVSIWAHPSKDQP